MTKSLLLTEETLFIFPPNEEDERKFSEYVKRISARYLNIEDRKIIRRLIEKALDIGIRKVTGMRKMQGIYLLEEPVPLYRCEQAKLYLGFSVQVSIREEKEEGDNNE